MHINGKIGKGKAYRYIGIDDDPLAEERHAIEQKRVEDYVAFCKASAGILPSGYHGETSIKILLSVIT